MGSAVSSSKLSQGCKNITLQFENDEPILHADCPCMKESVKQGVHEGVVVQGRGANIEDLMTTKHSSFPLNMVIGCTDGSFVWGQKNFSQLAKNIKLDGTVLKAELKKDDGTYSDASFDLDDRFYNSSGVLQAQEVPVVIAVPEETTQVFLNQLQESMAKNPNMKLTAIDHEDGTTTFLTSNDGSLEISGGIKTGDNKGDAEVLYGKAEIKHSDPDAIFQSVDAEARASIFHVAKETGTEIEQFQADVLTASASATAGNAYLGVDAHVSLVELKASVFDLNLGVGVETGAGIKDGSLDVKAAGCGFTIGRKVSISVFGGSFGIDFGRLF